MSEAGLLVRALQLGERIDLKGLERDDVFSTIPLAFHTPEGGTVVLFKSGTVVFLGLNPIAEDALIDSLGGRIAEPLPEGERESETARLVVKADADDLSGVHAADPDAGADLDPAGVGEPDPDLQGIAAEPAAAADGEEPDGGQGQGGGDNAPQQEGLQAREGARHVRSSANGGRFVHTDYRW